MNHYKNTYSFLFPSCSERHLIILYLDWTYIPFVTSPQRNILCILLLNYLFLPRCDACCKMNVFRIFEKLKRGRRILKKYLQRPINNCFSLRQSSVRLLFHFIGCFYCHEATNKWKKIEKIKSVCIWLNIKSIWHSY